MSTYQIDDIIVNTAKATDSWEEDTKWDGNRAAAVWLITNGHLLPCQTDPLLVGYPPEFLMMVSRNDWRRN